MSEIGNIYKQRTRDFSVAGSGVTLELRMHKDLSYIQETKSATGEAIFNTVQKYKNWDDYIILDFNNDIEYLRFLAWAPDRVIQKHIESMGKWPEKNSWAEYNEINLIEKNKTAS